MNSIVDNKAIAKSKSCEIIQLNTSIILVNKILDNASARNGNIHLAARNGNVKLVSAILHYDRSKVKLRDDDNMTAIHYAAKEGHIEVIDILIQYGTDINNRTGEKYEDDGEIYWEPGETPLILAASKGHLKTTKYLLNHGADISAQDQYGHTSLFGAVCGNHLEIAEYLLNEGSSLQVVSSLRHFNEIIGWHWELSPLHCASTVEMVDILLKNGANIDAKDRQNRTPLFYAAAHGEAKVVEKLLQYGANVNAKSSLFAYSYHISDTSLHYAIRNGNSEIVKILLQHGVNPNEVILLQENDEFIHNEYPLHCAVLNGFLEIVEILLEHGADPYIKNSQGETIFDLANGNSYNDLKILINSLS